MKSLSILFPVIAILISSTFAISPEIYLSYVDDIFVEIVKRATIPEVSSSSSSSSSSSPAAATASQNITEKENAQQPIIDKDVTVRKMRMTADDVQDNLRLLGWEEDSRASDINRSGHLLFPGGLDVFTIRKLSGPWKSSCYIIPFQQDGNDGAGDKVNEREEKTAELESDDLEEEMEEDEKKQGREVETQEEGDGDDEEEEEAISRFDRLAQLDAEAAENGIWRIPFNLQPEFVTIRGIVCVRRVP